jgi:uncharacterized damage-inducible protein DinB
MSSREFYLERRQAEHPIFWRVLKAVPADRLDYKPHERSPSAKDVLWTLTKELKACVDVVSEHKAAWNANPAPSYDEMLRLFEQWSNDLRKSVSEMDDPSWDRVAQFYANGKVVSEQSIGQFLWFIHFDAIHHRGQLSAYLRPMGATVPSIYGPSGDSRS